jgi:Holliday junction resolvase RusA-like endonuclease
MKFIIPYPENKTEQAAWNKRYSMNAIYSGKHWAKRNADKEFWHDLVHAYLKHQKVPQKLFQRPVQITFRWNDKLDIDNHAYLGKLIADGLKGYLLKDDSRKHYIRLTHEFHDKNFVEVEIQEVIE